MQIPQILLGLAATAAAIDVYLFPGKGCKGNSGVCRGLNPGVCCPGGNGNDLGSVGFYGIPTAWRIDAKGHNGGQCANTIAQSFVSGTTWVCIDGSRYSGGSYVFWGKKRGEGESSDGAKLDAFLLEDGTELNIADLDENSISEL
ncbi:hypothetical protein PFICI_08136 [Pestalotiopsis fici W106-1]|uniref:Uncharacterized protein n=1 Tax=Pestalotiopsis fici (strain W106-1 / CGMCC3.15140) TaxID=1229662 RepID=W3X5B4_PESFW|nr:uncharacterized protein PFICI_08136 [Pestalotiopsis fici W106-1]ETS80607.1 hypothetical protein PFICI_08136 [Pestalotiopsis fici W106-1]